MSAPTRRAVLAVCTALLLVTAGCSGGANPTSTTATTTDTTTSTTGTVTTKTTTNPTTATTATTTATGTWSPNASVEQYPPGVADNGTLVNASVLTDAHFDATANQTTAFTSAWTTGNDSHLRRLVNGPNSTPYYSVYNRTVDGERTTEELYGTESHRYGRMTFENHSESPVDNETIYPVSQNTRYTGSAWTQDTPFGPRHVLRSSLTNVNYSVNGTVERGDRTFVQLTADEVSETKQDSVTAYEGTVLVTPEGVVYNVEKSFERIVYDGIEGPTGDTNHVESSITLDTDVEWSGPPSWMENVPQLSLSIVEDGHAVEIRNTGGATLPVNASFRVDGSTDPTIGPAPRPPLRGDDRGTVTTKSPLEPGDALYVTAGANGSASSFALHDDPTRGDYVFASASLREGYGNTYYRMLTGIEPPPWQNESSYRPSLLAASLGSEIRTRY